MTAEALRAEITAALLELAWEQWSQLGVSAAPPSRREERATDPEALLLFTLHIGRSDPRLFDEVLDWLALNAPLISVQRLRNLCANDTDRALVDAALDWTASARRRQPAVSRDRQPSDRSELDPLFQALPAPRGELDPEFSRHGFARRPVKASGKSQSPRLHDPISFAFRLRRLLGVGVRAEVIRTLLTIRAPRLPSAVITASAGFAQRNVREGLTQLHEAGVIDVVVVSDDRHYSTRPGEWAALLRLPATPDLPLHYDWIPAFRALTRILGWVQDPAIAELSPYLRASRARTLMTSVEADLRYIGFPPAVNTARGADYWDEFAAGTMAAIHQTRTGA